jgi:peptidoglycan/xylan/chitin deacetylase (PgdA/CDA1 family)
MRSGPGRFTLGTLSVAPLRAFSKAAGADLACLCYHVVSEERLPHVAHLYSYKSPGQFARDLEFLARSFDFIDYRDFQSDRVPTHRHKPAVLLTFDDGFSECYSVIRPLLLKYGVPAIFFVTTGVLDNRSLMYRHKVSVCVDAYARLGAADAEDATRDIAPLLGPVASRGRDLAALLKAAPWNFRDLDQVCARLGVDVPAYLATVTPYLSTAEVLTLSRAGFTIGAHGVTHTPLGSCPASVARSEIVDSCAAVATLIGAAEVPFAFPFNGMGVEPKMLQDVRRAAIGVGDIFDTQSARRRHEHAINRIVVDRPPRGHGSTTNLPMAIGRHCAIALLGKLARRGRRARTATRLGGVSGLEAS